MPEKTLENVHRWYISFRFVFFQILNIFCAGLHSLKYKIQIIKSPEYRLMICVEKNKTHKRIRSIVLVNAQDSFLYCISKYGFVPRNTAPLITFRLFHLLVLLRNINFLFSEAKNRKTNCGYGFF